MEDREQMGLSATAYSCEKEEEEEPFCGSAARKMLQLYINLQGRIEQKAMAGNCKEPAMHAYGDDPKLIKEKGLFHVLVRMRMLRTLML